MHDKFAPHLSVILPAYNEAEQIADALKETSVFLDSFGEPYEIIVVDDHSSDATSLIVNEYTKEHPHVQLSKNTGERGKGGALKHGWSISKGEIVCFLDSDLDLHPRLLGPLLQELANPGIDAVIGSKQHPQSVVRYSLKRRLMSWGYCTIIALLFRLPVHDTQTGIKVFRRKALNHVMPLTRLSRYAHDLETILLLHYLKYTVSEAPVTVLFHRTSGARIGWKAALETLLDTLRLRIRFLRRPT